ncbi:hypothetical protein DER45DRAFT_318690 [Fusarium avenaceum]|nr:hypothetical protein DER45DRAFT_318690 [Fusarium avenaceum]
MIPITDFAVFTVQCLVQYFETRNYGVSDGHFRGAIFYIRRFPPSIHHFHWPAPDHYNRDPLICHAQFNSMKAHFEVPKHSQLTRSPLKPSWFPTIKLAIDSNDTKKFRHATQRYPQHRKSASFSGKA